MIIAKAIQMEGQKLPNLTFIFETDEESGSKDIVYYLEQYKSLFTKPDLFICLDSGALDYERMYLTTSLRGSIKFTIKT